MVDGHMTFNDFEMIGWTFKARQQVNANKQQQRERQEIENTFHTTRNIVDCV